MLKHLFLFPFLSLTFSTFSQADTLKVMYYNVLEFPNQTSHRVDTLKKIIQYVQPDIFVVTELENQFGANLILNGALNTSGTTTYAPATFFGSSNLNNMLFYNSDKVGLLEQSQIVTSLRDISEYKVYYKSPNLSTTQDTAIMWLYACHLKAGSGQSNESRRHTEIQSLNNYLINHGRSGNMLVGGDFNFYTSSEPACQALLSGGNIAFKDPIDTLGNWSNSSNFVDFHTQSTRSSTGLGGGAGSGMDDRFDFIFVNDDVLNGSRKVKYVPDSYEAIGQDGNHYNTSINSGTNTSVPADIANSLFYMSDHLPVYMELAMDVPVGIQEQNELISNYRFDPASGLLRVFVKDGITNFSISVVDLAGKIVCQKPNNSSAIELNLNQLPHGIYMVTISSEIGASSLKIAK